MGMESGPKPQKENISNDLIEEWKNAHDDIDVADGPDPVVTATSALGLEDLRMYVAHNEAHMTPQQKRFVQASIRLKEEKSRNQT